jgi:methyltransferase
MPDRSDDPLIGFLLAIVFVPMLFEARLAARHERALVRAGAHEPQGDVYRVMQVLYPACFLAMIAESWRAGMMADAAVAAGALLFGASKALKYWAIATLGPRWTFRVLVPPDAPRIVSGPYRWLRHPNYIAVVGELIGVGLMAHASVLGVVSLIAFGALIAKRISVEEGAMSGAALQRPPSLLVETVPIWLRMADGAVICLLAIALWSAVTGGARSLVLGVVVATRSPWPFLGAAAAVLLVRHVARPRPSIWARARGLIAAIDANLPLSTALRAGFLTRVGVLVAGLLSVAAFGYPRDAGFMLSDNVVANLPGRFDAGWYGSIALEGYDRDHAFDRQRNMAFFPAAPLSMRLLGGAFGVNDAAVPQARRMTRVLWAGVVVSVVAFLAALHYLVRLGSEMVGERAARPAAVLLAAYPFSVFYSAPYSEALFLLGAVATVFYFRRGAFVAASLWGIFTGLTRPNGFLLSVLLGLLACGFDRRGTVGDRRPAWPGQLAVAAAPVVGMLGFTVYLHEITGVWFAWARSHAAWGRSFQGLGPFVAGFASLSGRSLVDLVASPSNALNALALLFTCALVWPVTRRLGVAWGVFILVTIVPPFLAGGLLSMARLSSTLFPLFLALAAMLPSRVLPAWAATFGIGQGICAALFFGWRALY